MRGLSELISTILIVALVVGVSGIVIKFSTNYVKSSENDINKVTHVDPFASLDITSATSTKIEVENTGQRVLKNFKVYVDGTKYNIVSAPQELELSQPAEIEISPAISPGTHTIYVLTDKSRTKQTVTIQAKTLELALSSGQGENVNTSSGITLAYQ